MRATPERARRAETMLEIDTARVICALAEIGDPGARGFTCGAGDWPLRGFVVRRGELVRAYVNYCPHAGHALDLLPHRFLTSDGALILCSSHGALFASSSRALRAAARYKSHVTRRPAGMCQPARPLSYTPQP